MGGGTSGKEGDAVRGTRTGSGMDEAKREEKGLSDFTRALPHRQAYLHGNDMRRGRTDGVPPVALLKVVGEGQSTAPRVEGI